MTVNDLIQNPKIPYYKFPWQVIRKMPYISYQNDFIISSDQLQSDQIGNRLMRLYALVLKRGIPVSPDKATWSPEETPTKWEEVSEWDVSFNSRNLQYATATKMIMPGLWRVSIALFFKEKH